MAIATASTIGITTDSYGIYKKNNSASVDNVFIFSDGTDKWEIIDKKGPYIARYGGVLNTGANMLSRLNTILAHSSVKEVVFDNGDITLTGTLNCSNKKITFINDAKFVGTYTISSGLITAGYRQFIFGGTPTLTGCSTTTDRSSIMWYGAVGSGSVNDAPAIQKAMDTAIANNFFPRDLYFPKNTGAYYRCDSALIAYNWNGTTYDFFTLNLIGEQSGNFTSSGFSTVLSFAEIDSFAIGYQRARSSTIRGLQIDGGFTLGGYASTKEIFDQPYATWVTAHTSCRDNKYSPFTGISIDPFFNEVDTGGSETGVIEANRYQNYLSWYRGTGTRGGSSSVHVKECRVTGFTVGIGYSLNGWTLNCENCIAESVCVENVKAAFAFGQAQIKDNYIRNTIHWGGVHTLIDGVTYGTNSGLRPCVAYIDGVNIAGLLCRLFNTTSNFTGSVRNIFAESIYKIGDMLNLAPFNMYDCEFNFHEISATKSIPDYHINATWVKFQNCTFKYYDDLFDKRIVLKGSNMSFEACRLDLMPILPSVNSSSQVARNIDFINCYSGNGKLIGANIIRGVNSYIAGEELKIFSMSSTPLQTSDFYNTYSPDWKNDFSISYPSYVTLTVNTTTREASFTWSAAYVANLLVGDYMVEAERVNIPFIDGGTNDPYPCVGRIKTIDYGTGDIIIQDIPRHITNASNYFLAALIQKEAQSWVVGDATNGSPTLTNVICQDNLSPTSFVGTRIGNRLVSSADNAARTMTFASNFTTTLAGTIVSPCLINPYIQNYVYAPLDSDINAYTLPFLSGTVWDMPQTYVYTPDVKRKVWVCTKSGYLSASTLGLGSQYQSEWALQLSEVTTADSLQGNGTASSPIKLDNDNNAPGNSKYYGTDSGGAKGYFSLPTAVITGSGAFSSKIRVVDNVDFTVASDDYVIVLKNATTNKNMTMLTASGNTNKIIRIINTGTSTITSDIAIRTNASTTFTVTTATNSIEVQSDGTDWWLLDNYTR